MSCEVQGVWYPIRMATDKDGKKIIVPATNSFYTDENVLKAKNLTFLEENCIFGDGVVTSIISINDQFPGPTIEVRDRNVRVENRLVSDWIGTRTPKIQT